MQEEPKDADRAAWSLGKPKQKGEKSGKNRNTSGQN
jgi:hypothetical protein